jgi:hypothetical protein
MTPAGIIRQAATEGVRLMLSPTGAIKATGNAETVKRWLPAIRENKPGILAELARNPELFDFAPPADPESDREAIEERAGIIAEGCGMEPAQALQEALWRADGERAWRAFISNAKRILSAPEGDRTALLHRYGREAAGRYGERAAADMACTMRGWIKTRTTEGGGQYIYDPPKIPAFIYRVHAAKP